MFDLYQRLLKCKELLILNLINQARQKTTLKKLKNKIRFATPVIEIKFKKLLIFFKNFKLLLL